MKIRVYDINWEYDYDNYLGDGDPADWMTIEEYDKTFDQLPTEIEIESDDDINEEDLEDFISDYISDESGYYHEGFSYEILK